MTLRLQAGWAKIEHRLAAQAGLIFVLTIVTRVLTMLATGIHRELFVAELQKTAQSLAFSGVFGNPYLLPTGPTAHVSPVYTSMVAGIYYLFGTDLHGQLILFLFNIALTGLQFALIPFAAKAMRIDRSVGFVAGLLAALFPIHFKVEIRAGDTPLFGAMLLGLFVLTLREWRKPGFTWSRALLFGLAWGAGALTNPVLLPVFATVLVITFLRKARQEGWLLTGVQALASLLVLCAVFAPWTIRNERVLGGFVIARSNLGIEMRLAYNDSAHPDMLATFYGPASRLYHPFVALEPARAVVQEGEVGYNHRLLRDALRWISDNPSRAARLTLARVVYFWFPKTPEVSRVVILSVLSILAFGGLFLLRRQSADTFQLVLAVWLSYPLIFYLLISSPRYRYPLTWMLLILAVHACRAYRFRALSSARLSLESRYKAAHGGE